MITLRPYQEAAIRGLYGYWEQGKGRNPLLVAPTGCHEKGHLILMHNGDTKPVEKICVGDMVMGPDGLPRRVVKLHRGEDDMIEVTPKKGETFVVNAGHLFSLYRTPEKKGMQSSVAEVTAGDFHLATKWFKHLHKIQRCAVDFPEAEQSIPAWIVGAFIGDGSMTQGTPRITTAEKEVVAKVSAWAESKGCKITIRWDNDRKTAWDCTIVDPTASRSSPNRCRELFKSIGLVGKTAHHKRVPRQYMIASRKQRLDILAGLIDTDGSATKGGYDWISASEGLADDIVFICRSLGLAAYKTECTKSCQNNFSGTYWRVSISGDCSIVPCRVPRRIAPKRRQKKRVDVTAITTRHIGRGQYFGFELDGDRLYLDGHFVRHHNSGKTPMIGQIVSDALAYNSRVVIVTHVKELIDQGARTLRAMIPGAEIGIYSASLRSKDLSKPITYAQIQSVHKRAHDMPVPDLVIIDEAHLVPAKSSTRYGKFLAAILARNPECKIIGLTATPYRLDQGWLHKGEKALFDGIAHDIKIGDLMDDGWLSPIVSKAVKQSIDLTNVRIKGGEYREDDLAKAASDPLLVKAAAAEIVQRGADRQSWLVFCCGVGHAQLVCEAIQAHGIDAEVLIGSHGSEERDNRIARFKAGELRCLVNVNVLTTGFDAPGVDLLAILRATQSPSLYVQMVGRGTRLNEGKENCLVLDYGSNVNRHGLIDDIKPKTPGKGEEPIKTCPDCASHIPIGVMICPDCGFVFESEPQPIKPRHDSKAYEGALLKSQAPRGSLVKYKYLPVSHVTYSIHKKEGKPDSLKVTYHCGLSTANEWLCPQHGGYAMQKYYKRLVQMKCRGAPATAEQALASAQDWPTPVEIKVKQDGDFLNVVEVYFENL